MNTLPDYNFRVYGLKLTKSEKFVDAKGTEIWDGTNNLILLGQFKDLTAAIHFAENVKNNSPKKSWKITVHNVELDEHQEIHYTERETYSNQKKAFYYQK